MEVARKAAWLEFSRFFVFRLDSPALEEALLAHYGGLLALGRRSALPSSAAVHECFQPCVIVVVWSPNAHRIYASTG